ncbi:MAG: helix-turn-helix domain-containing protein [Acidimicrobiia bacterium]|nr:helix-turn-helix domain-containing protein [Acidimicrobiia bacterium]
MDLASVAAYLHTTERHVRALVARRAIPYLKVGKYLRFDQADIDDWLDSSRVEVADWRIIAGQSLRTI